MPEAFQASLSGCPYQFETKGNTNQFGWLQAATTKSKKNSELHVDAFLAICGCLRSIVA
jgi:hypothetical protein